MRRQVDYHLAHARAAASGATLGARCAVRGSAEGLARTLLRLHAERGLTIDVEVAAGPHASRVPARGSRRDARQPARQRLQVGAVARRRHLRGSPARPSSSRWTTTARDSIRRCARRCCSAACAPTKPRPAPASAWRSSAIWRSSTAGSIALDSAPLGGLRARLDADQPDGPGVIE